MACYGNVAAADIYFGQRLHAWDWENAIPADKQKALNQATELIDQFQYIDDKDDESQELEFPRTDMTAVPTAIENACYLIAKALLSGRDPEMDLEHLATKAESYGNVRTAYDRDGTLQEHLAHLIPSPQAWNLIRPYLREKKVAIIKRV